jgi:hypothetical protein
MPTSTKLQYLAQLDRKVLQDQLVPLAHRDKAELEPQVVKVLLVYKDQLVHKDPLVLKAELEPQDLLDHKVQPEPVLLVLLASLALLVLLDKLVLLVKDLMLLLQNGNPAQSTQPTILLDMLLTTAHIFS